MLDAECLRELQLLGPGKCLINECMDMARLVSQYTTTRAALMQYSIVVLGDGERSL